MYNLWNIVKIPWYQSRNPQSAAVHWTCSVTPLYTSTLNLTSEPTSCSIREPTSVPTRETTTIPTNTSLSLTTAMMGRQEKGKQQCRTTSSVSENRTGCGLGRSCFAWEIQLFSSHQPGLRAVLLLTLHCDAVKRIFFSSTTFWRQNRGCGVVFTTAFWYCGDLVLI